MNPFPVFIILIAISSSLAQNFDQFAIGNGINPGYPFLQQSPPPPPPSPPMMSPPHGPGPHGPGHVHAPHPDGPHELFRQTPRHGGPGHAGPPPPNGPYATGLRYPPGYQYGLPPPPHFQVPSPYPNPMGIDQLMAQMTTSTVECSCSVSFGIQNASALVLPQAPQSSFPGIVCGPGSVALCRIQCMAQALNASFDLLNQAVNPASGNGVSLQQFICGNQVNNTETGSTASENNGRMVNIKSETSCSEQSTDYSSTNRRTEAISLGPQECSALASIGSFQLPTITSAVPSPAN